MIINTQEDLNAIAGTSEYEQFIATLRGSLFTVRKDEVTQKWVADENNETIERFGLTREDFEPIEQPVLPINETANDQLLQQLTQERKAQERQGVTINGIRYAGDPGNRQTLQEAIAYIEDAGLTEFAIWKDSDGVFHQNNPLADVKDAARAIGARRSQLIAAEGEYAAQIIAGTLTDLSEVVWP
jgi:hypothetical protein